MRGSHALNALMTISAQDEKLAHVEVNNALNALQRGSAVDMSFKTVRKARSTDANALMWHCLTEIATALFQFCTLGQVAEAAYLQVVAHLLQRADGFDDVFLFVEGCYYS